MQLGDVEVLLSIKQQPREDVVEFLLQHLTEEQYSRFNELGLLKEVKAKNKTEHLYNRLRLSEKGTKLLEDLSIPEVTQEDLIMANYLMEMYLKHEDEERTIGNRKLIAIYCCQFRNYLGLSLHQMYYLCVYFLGEFTYTKVLENIFFDKNKNRYGKFKDNIDDSKLYQFYLDRKPQIEEMWAAQGLTN